MPREYDCADELNGALDHFLECWEWVRPHSMEMFTRQNAAWLGLDGFPRRALDTLRPMGIEVVREAIPAGTCAIWTLDDARYRIRLSPFQSEERANFTLWHEWFEIMAARPSFPASLSGHALERAADRFAACITMPAGDIRCVARQFRGSGDKASVLAARFGVGTAAMRVRLRELGLTQFDPDRQRVPDTI